MDSTNAGQSSPDFKECSYCKKNNEEEVIYRSHNMKDSEGRVMCPVLRSFVCRCCGATGDNAHSIMQCPLSADTDRMNPMYWRRRMTSSRRRAIALCWHVHVVPPAIPTPRTFAVVALILPTQRVSTPPSTNTGAAQGE